MLTVDQNNFVFYSNSLRFKIDLKWNRNLLSQKNHQMTKGNTKPFNSTTNLKYYSSAIPKQKKLLAQ